MHAKHLSVKPLGDLCVTIKESHYASSTQSRKWEWGRLAMPADPDELGLETVTPLLHQLPPATEQECRTRHQQRKRGGFRDKIVGDGHTEGKVGKN